MKKLRLLLLPLGYLYGIIVEGIKLTYSLGWRKSQQFNLPVVIVGNLSTGGTGKTPHVEYFLGKLTSSHNIVVLSRGYGRKTKGFRWVQKEDKALNVGDEPLQICRKFPESTIVVAEKRVPAIQKIRKDLPGTQLLLLDDGMQHWPLSGSCYIMLTSFSEPFFNDWILPVGNLREFRFNYKRANIIIVSKCPPDINELQRQEFLKKIMPGKHQKVYFSYLKYGLPYHINETAEKFDWDVLQKVHILLVTGIANPKLLLEKLNMHCRSVQSYRVADHYNYSSKDWSLIMLQFLKIREEKGSAFIFTTEKDAIRLLPFVPTMEKIPLYIVPIEVVFAFGEEPVDFMHLPD